jgi:hypothetical protein
LLQTGHDGAATRRRTSQSRNLLPGRPSNGAAEGLIPLFVREVSRWLLCFPGPFSFAIHSLAMKEVVTAPRSAWQNELAAVLRELCEDIFEEQMDGWYRVPSSWPQHRSYEVFCQWFEYQYHSMLFDLCDEPLIRE